MAVAHYHGSCQCGAVSFEVDANLEKTVTCNCSRCQRLGIVLAFAAREVFTLKSGADNLTEYLFNKKTIEHQFCKTCGIESFAYSAMPDGTKMVAVNVNCLDGVDPRALTSQHYDGASH
ncbi:glutathione-dependent formaldehyde-activating GFA [Rhizobium sp. PDO1-076]|uniref:GFA family protein n=1 Tax=Rhizobium sp. PDO1-076 TaxID=1125979 RepID=UPI00024E27F2|nr:GFA family protein [Rhizobium sp. PDO1-076]EHS49922.1 glutathione-dependent formaldehyde-activating GFA [Rhizobium sp. PDO1-076]